MNQTDITTYIQNPNISPLKVVSFKVNYPSLITKVKDEVNVEEIRLIDSNYKPIFFNLLFKLVTLTDESSLLKSHILINPENIKDILIQQCSMKVFSFNNNVLIILSQNLLVEIEPLETDTLFLIKLCSLDQTLIIAIKTEIETLSQAQPSIVNDINESEIRNTSLNSLYMLNLLNVIITDYHSHERKFSLISTIDSKLRKMLVGLIKKSNMALQMNDDSMYIGVIALTSLIIENRLADIYGQKNGSYNDDKTLGGLISDLKSQGYIAGIERPLEQFKDIRNNLIHYHRRTFKLYDSFAESMKYIGQFLIWCEQNGYL